MSTIRLHRPFLVQRGIHLVPARDAKNNASPTQPVDFYKLAAVGAALFLVFSIC